MTSFVVVIVIFEQISHIPQLFPCKYRLDNGSVFGMHIYEYQMRTQDFASKFGDLVFCFFKNLAGVRSLVWPAQPVLPCTQLQLVLKNISLHQSDPVFTRRN